MNEEHLRLCASTEWAELVERVLLPWVLDGHGLGDEVLEVGAGPGLVTDALRQRVPLLVAAADATALPFASGRFSTVACFTMLHHVPTVAMQDQMLRELRRVVRVGGILIGTDGMDTSARRALHEGDTFLPARPEELPGRLTAAGFTDPEVEVSGDRFRFLAQTPR